MQSPLRHSELSFAEVGPGQQARAGQSELLMPAMAAIRSCYFNILYEQFQS